MGQVPYFAAWLAVALAVVGITLTTIAHPESPGYLIGGLSTLASWGLLPLAAYFDIRHVRRISWWQPDGPPWMINFLVPFWAILAWVVYSLYRYERAGELERPPSQLPKAKQPRQPRPQPRQRNQRRRQKQAQQQSQRQLQRRKQRRGK